MMWVAGATVGPIDHGSCRCSSGYTLIHWNRPLSQSGVQCLFEATKLLITIEAAPPARVRLQSYVGSSVLAVVGLEVRQALLVSHWVDVARRAVRVVGEQV